MARVKSRGIVFAGAHGNRPVGDVFGMALRCRPVAQPAAASYLC